MPTSRSGCRSLRGAATFFILCLGLVGCGPKAPEAVAPGDAANQVGDVFAQAPPEIKTLADGVAQAMASDNLPRAHMLLQTLIARTDLTPDQRDVATGAFLGVGEKLRESAATGDEKAQEFQRLHQGSK